MEQAGFRKEFGTNIRQKTGVVLIDLLEASYGLMMK
jgi:hypothetical protein